MIVTATVGTVVPDAVARAAGGAVAAIERNPQARRGFIEQMSAGRGPAPATPTRWSPSLQMKQRIASAAALVAVALWAPPTSLAQTAAGPDIASGAETATGTGIETWEVDRSHSRIGFSVRHFFTPVEGSFGEYEIDLAFDPASPERGHVSVTIDATSVDTGNQRRDDDLRGGQFFEVTAYPTLTFESSSFRRVAADEYVAAGDLTIRDVTKPIELTVKVLGLKELDGDLERFGRAVAGLEASTTIDRRDFDIGTGRWAETVVLGPDVEITILLEAKLR